MAKIKREVDSDMNMNPELREQIQDMRGIIADRSGELPKGFVEQPNGPGSFIINQANGKMTEIGLYALSEVKKALRELL